MARLKNESSALLADLHHRLDALVAAAVRQGRESALADIRNLVGGTLPGARPARTPRARRATAKKSSSRPNPWAAMTPEQRLARVNAIRKGRGLPPKDAL